MVAIKPAQAQSFPKSIPAKFSAFLFHGSDPGLIAELAKRTADAVAARDKPAAEILRIDDADLDGDPDRLAVELQTMAMFGGGKVVRTSTGRRINGPMLAGLIEGGPLAACLIVEAGALKATDAVRKAFEKADFAAAIACYSDGDRDLEGLVRDMLGEARITAEPAVRDSLVARLGADRALSRQEIEKLILYAGPGAALTLDDIDAIVGDAAEQALDRVTLAVAGGRSSTAVIECDRAVAAGQSPQSILLAVERHFLQLHRLRAMSDGGRPAEEAVRQMRPPVHFKIQDALITQCRLWNEAALTSALQRITAAVKATRTSDAPEGVLVERLLMELASHAKSLTGNRTAARR